jgi:molecular chaperone DnaK (HSP70)
LIISGIDLGTTFTCISFFDTANISNKTKVSDISIFINEYGNKTTPTALYFNPENDQILFGETAIQQRNKVLLCWKLIMGKTWDEINPELQHFFISKGLNLQNHNGYPYFEVEYNNEIKLFSPTDLSTIYLKYITQNIEKGSSVITIPAYFNNNSRDATKIACENVGLNILKIINEPTAASLCYHFNEISTKVTTPTIPFPLNVCVFDCGGGTTDISYLNIDFAESCFSVLDVLGDNNLGGEDLTLLLVKYIIQKFKVENNSKNFNKIKKQAEKCKLALSFCDSFNLVIENVTINGKNADLNFNISYNLFLMITKPFFDKIKTLLLQFNENEPKKDIHKIIFVGGSTKFPYFKELFKDIYPNIEINNSIDPDISVSIGATIQCLSLLNLEEENFTSDLLLLDITPLGLGVQSIGGLMETIIPRNSVVPVTRTKIFTNDQDETTEMIIKVFQGESLFVQHNYFLSSFKLTGLNPAFDKGQMNIAITFNIDSSGILFVTAKDLATLNNISLMIKKEIIEENLPENLEEIVLNSEYTKVIENEIANKILFKIEFYDKYQELLTIFHQKRAIIAKEEYVSNFTESDLTNFTIFRFNKLFSNTKNILDNFLDYTLTELENFKEKFQEEWYQIMFNLEDSEISERGSTKIKNLN